MFSESYHKVHRTKKKVQTSSRSVKENTERKRGRERGGEKGSEKTVYFVPNWLNIKSTDIKSSWTCYSHDPY